MLAVLVLVACKERGTISIPTVQPCVDDAPTSVAVYLKPATTCDDPAVTCGLRDFECIGDCLALCPEGRCSIDELMAGLEIDPPDAGDYVLVMSFRYGDASIDQGVVCVEVKVDADGTASSTVEPDPEGQACCIQP